MIVERRIGTIPCSKKWPGTASDIFVQYNSLNLSRTASEDINLHTPGRNTIVARREILMTEGLNLG